MVAIPKVSPVTDLPSTGGAGWGGGHRLDRDRLRDVRPGCPSLTGRLDHRGRQLGSALNTVPRAVAAHDDAMLAVSTEAGIQFTKSGP